MRFQPVAVPRMLTRLGATVLCMAMLTGCSCMTDACLPFGVPSHWASQKHSSQRHCRTCGPGPCVHGVGGYSPPHYGYAPTCWQRFPADWQGCAPQSGYVIGGNAVAPTLVKPEILPEPGTPYYEPADQLKPDAFEPDVLEDEVLEDEAEPLEEPTDSEQGAELDEQELEESISEEEDELPADEIQPQMPRIIRGAPQFTSVDDEEAEAEAEAIEPDAELEEEYVDEEVPLDEAADEPELIGSEFSEEDDGATVAAESDEQDYESEILEESTEEPLRSEANP